MKSPDEIRSALAKLAAYDDWRDDVLAAAHPIGEDWLRAMISDAGAQDASAFSEALEWVLGINSGGPESENPLEELLRQIPSQN